MSFYVVKGQMRQTVNVKAPKKRTQSVTEGAVSLSKVRGGGAGGKKKIPSEAKVKSIYENKFKENNASWEWLLQSYRPSDTIDALFDPQNPNYDTTSEDFQFRGDMALEDIFEKAKQAKIGEPSENEFSILLAQVHFWFQEFNYFVVSPCDFTQPSLAFSSDETFRRIIMYSLFKIFFAFNGNSQLYGPLLAKDKVDNGAIATTEQWKQFVTLLFPFTSLSLWPLGKDGKPRGEEVIYVSKDLTNTMNALEPIVTGKRPYEIIVVDDNDANDGEDDVFQEAEDLIAQNGEEGSLGDEEILDDEVDAMAMDISDMLADL